METAIVELNSHEEKKHSVRYFPNKALIDGTPIFESIYIRKEYLGGTIPTKLKVTIEEVQ
jgi:hypothetical protein